MFAKLYGEKEDQILATLLDENDGPRITFHFVNKGKVVKLALDFIGTQEGIDEARKAFEAIDEEKAKEVTVGAIRRGMV